MKKLFSFVAILFLSACSMGESTAEKQKETKIVETEETILTDENTKATVEEVEAEENTKLIEWGSDAMDRGNHDYDTITHNSLVVEMRYEKVRRGDVVYYRTPKSAISKNSQLPEYYIARVVGLPGETVEIRDGQVYVDDKKLDMFYGVATDRGLEKDEYFEMAEQNFKEGNWTKDAKFSEKERITWVNMDAKKEYFATSMEPVKVSNEAIFVLVDQWWRGIDSKDFGELSLEVVEGKVLGYAKNRVE